MTTASDAAVFDHQDHAREPGWATYHQKRHRRRSLRCLFGHDLPPKPVPANGHSPDNYGRCFRCDAPLKWYVFGQHRWGGMNAPTPPKESSLTMHDLRGRYDD